MNILSTGASPSAPLRSRKRVAFVNTHPIQYFAPMYRYLVAHANLSVTALYLSDYSIRGSEDRAFGRVVKWDVDLLSGYDARFVSGADERPERTGFFSVVAPSIWREVHKGHFDALIVHGHTPVANLLAVAAARASGTPVFMRGETHLGLSRSALKKRLRRPLLGTLYNNVDGVFAIGAANAAFYSAMGVPASRIFSMPYTIDNARFTAEARLSHDERNALRREMGVSGDIPIILYAAKFMNRKRPGDLIRAARRLEQQGAKFQLVLAGSGELEPMLKALVDELDLRQVHFSGFVNQSRLPKIYGASDLFVLPSEQESWGLAINEAMCAGLPIVASEEIGCVEDLVRHDVNGRTFRAGDIEGLVRALSPLVESADLRRRMGDASREIISRWSYAECAAGLHNALQRVARR